MNNRIQLTPEELLMGRMAALIESPYEPSEDYVERYERVTDMSLDQDTIKNLNNLTPEQHRKVRNIIRWQRIGCIVVKISETLDVSLKEALDPPKKEGTESSFHVKMHAVPRTEVLSNRRWRMQCHSLTI